ncbi:MAG: DUF4136 domain-containing protein [Steroidobacteraceae bacterium]|jgi:hypothetical protein
MSIRHLAGIALALLFLSACQSGPEIRRDSVPGADVAGFRTFGFYEELATDRAGYESVFTARLKAAVRKEMEWRGYRYEPGQPELRVNFFANVETRQEIREYPLHLGYFAYRRHYGYGFYTPEWEVVNYRQGTLTIDLVDAARNTLVWTATAEGRVSEDVMRRPGRAVDETVTLMLRPLPSARRVD